MDPQQAANNLNNPIEAAGQQVSRCRQQVAAGPLCRADLKKANSTNNSQVTQEELLGYDAQKWSL